MSFANPLYLWGFLGLIVPLAIHLWSKREGRIIQVGSVRNYPVSESKKSRSIRLNEVVLLCLRLLFITFLVLLLSGLKLTREKARSSVTLIDPSVYNDPEYTIFIDSLVRTSEELRFFSKGFPLIKDASDAFNNTRVRFDYWDLISSTKSFGADSIHVFSKSLMSDFKGDKPDRTNTIAWTTLPDKSDKTHLVDAYMSSSGKIRCVVAYSSDLSFRSEILNASEIPELQKQNTPDGSQVKLGDGSWIWVKEHKVRNVSIFYDKGFENDALYLKAALQAVGTYLDIHVQVSSFLSEIDAELNEINIWLSDDSPSDLRSYLLKYSYDEFADNLIEKNKGTYWLTQRLNREVVFDQDLVGSLIPLLYDLESVDKRLDSLDSRVLPVAQIQSVFNDNKEVNATENAEVSNLLWVFVILFLTFERVLAFKRKQ
ncbi:MAG: BatA domain-containing protein [Bacteroidota bacterium]